MPRKALLLANIKVTNKDGTIVQIKAWRLPHTTTERPHGLKYSLFYGREGERIIGYDNETGKGDHRHYRNREAPYRFLSLDQLVADFLADVAREQTDERG